MPVLAAYRQSISKVLGEMRVLRLIWAIPPPFCRDRLPADQLPKTNRCGSKNFFASVFVNNAVAITSVSFKFIKVV